MLVVVAVAVAVAAAAAAVVVAVVAAVVVVAVVVVEEEEEESITRAHSPAVFRCVSLILRRVLKRLGSTLSRPRGRWVTNPI